MHHQTAEATLFIRFFEFVQGKSFSEAICESIGSIMNMATSSGRILHPTNFAKEIFLRFNLPPLHTAMTNIVPDTLSHELLLKRRSLSGEQILILGSCANSTSVLYRQVWETSDRKRRKRSSVFLSPFFSTKLGNYDVIMAVETENCLSTVQLLRKIYQTLFPIRLHFGWGSEGGGRR